MAGFVPLLRAQDTQKGMFADAEAYERFMGRWSRLLAPVFVDFAGLPEQGRVLDVGSGTGSLSFAIAERDAGVRVVGIDPSKEYIAYARSRNRSPERLTFEVGDAQQLHFADASFDAALSLLVFNFIPDPKKALLEVRRVIRSGGRVAAAVWDYADGMRMLRIFWDAVIETDPAAEKLDEKHMPFCHSGQLSSLWRQGGFENVREQSIEIRTRFDSFAAYWDSFRHAQGPAGLFVRRLDSNRVAVLRNAVKRRLSITGEDTPIDLAARAWAVCGIVPDRR